jgi:hypothetical protein
VVTVNCYACYTNGDDAVTEVKTAWVVGIVMITVLYGLCPVMQIVSTVYDSTV